MTEGVRGRDAIRSLNSRRRSGEGGGGRGRQNESNINKGNALEDEARALRLS
jgi:hypothetical protein